METSDGGYSMEKAGQPERDKRRNHPASNRVFTGLFVIALGAFFLLQKMGVDFPHWFFDWPMILIVIGIFVGIRHNFRAGGWIIPILVGSVAIINETLTGFSLHDYIWPMAIIGLGLFIILRPKKNRPESWSNFRSSVGSYDRNSASTEDVIDSVSVFGGNKKNIISKDFKGGDIVIFFGGMELNLTQADVVAPVELEITQFFGGTKLIVPSNWKIISEVVTVFGSFEDKRPIMKEIPEGDKVLILRGTCVFGGIDVKSY